MKYIKYIALLPILLLAACTTEMLEQPSLNRDGNGMIQVVSRVIPFSDRDVTTRANKNNAEIKVTSIDYFIFTNDDICIFHQRVNSTDPLSIDRSSSDFEVYDLTKCYIVSIANAPAFNVDCGTTTWEDVASQNVSVSGIDIPRDGLTMIGRYPEETDDPNVVNLDELPAGEVLTIPMETIFSKIVINLSVDSNQLLPGENQPLPTFTLTGCEVHNVASEVDFRKGTESSSGGVDGTDDPTSVNSDVYSVNAYGETFDGGSAISFSFYLPERFLHAGTSASTFQYPFGTGTSIREEDENYRQRYKPMLAKGYAAYNSSYDESKDKKATYVTLKGTYSDHQGHSFKVSYDIYVGRDNYGNFDIVRNAQYNNNVVIRGINNSSDQSADNAAVSIDHRVNVERMDPIIINFRRETLLDSHFEVRPLRVRKNPDFSGDLANAKVKIEVAYDETPATNWIGLERSFGNGTAVTSSSTYLVDNDLAADRKNSAGKRKYFTTDLTTNTLNGAGTIGGDGFSTAGGKTVIVPVTDANQCVWIYVDECVTPPGDAVRSAKIKVSYATDGTTYSTPVEYVINQRLLFPVTYGDNEYSIEYHEEYLYNYDSEDQFGQTDYEGMEWGLDGVQLSHTHMAYFSTGSWQDIENWLVQNSSTKIFYDFYLTRDIANTSATRRDNAGYTFASEIINYVPEYFSPITLAGVPDSAVEYCYNRNKRNEDGSITSVNWYLPAIDEIENIMMGAYTDFLVFQDKLYWSSQPAFLRGRGHYYSAAITQSYADYYYDDKTSARATKIAYTSATGYNNISSGVEGYGQYMDIYKPLWGMNNEPNIMEITKEPFSFVDERDNTQTIEKMTDKTNHPGNKLRTDKARIRCVYKAN